MKTFVIVLKENLIKISDNKKNNKETKKTKQTKQNITLINFLSCTFNDSLKGVKIFMRDNPNQSKVFTVIREF